MIDIHTHLLPGIDDGVDNFNESVQALRENLKRRIDTIVLTPHYKKFIYNTCKDDNIKLVNELKNYCTKENVDVNLILGHEVYLNRSSIIGLLNDEISTMGNTDYILVEIPMFGIIKSFEYYLRWVIELGYIPIIAHLERYRFFKYGIKDIKRWIAMGAKIQINCGGPFGEHGMFAKKISKKLLDNKLVHFIASDQHTTDEKYYLDDAYKFIKDNYNERYAIKLMIDNPSKMLNNEEVILYDGVIE